LVSSKLLSNSRASVARYAMECQRGHLSSDHANDYNDHILQHHVQSYLGN